MTYMVTPRLYTTVQLKRALLMSNDYKAPEVDDLGKKEESPKTQPTPSIPNTVAKAQGAKFEPVPLRIGIGQMVNGKGNAVTDIMKERIDRHLTYLAGKKGFTTDTEREDEQTSFIEIIGSTLTLPFPQYVIVTDYLLAVIRENREIFANGTAFRFTYKLRKEYPMENVKLYHTYMTFLTFIAGNWEARHRLNRIIDLGTAIRDLPRKGKENVTQYFNKLQNV